MISLHRRIVRLVAIGLGIAALSLPATLALAQTGTPTATTTETPTASPTGVIATPPASSGGITVSPTGTDSSTCGAAASPCKTIGQALENAQSGATVTVESGTYAEMVVITKPVTLLGQSATIDATGLDNGILIKASNTTVSGFTVSNATGEGILAMSVSNVTISYNTVTNNDRGGGSSAYPECAPQGEVPGDCGEGIHLMSTTGSTVSNNDVRNNLGGILMTDELGPSHDNLIASNTVENNAPDCGITTASHSSTAVTAAGLQPDKGGIYNNRITLNTVKDNGEAGVGVFAAGPGGANYNNTVSNNTISGNGQAAIVVHAHAPLQNISGNTFSNNVIGQSNSKGDPDAGDTQTTGILIWSAVVPVTGTTITGNQISNNEIGIWVSANVNTEGFSNNTFTSVATQVYVKPAATPSPSPSASPSATPTGTATVAPAPPNTGSGVANGGGLSGVTLLLVSLGFVVLAGGSLLVLGKASKAR